MENEKFTEQQKYLGGVDKQSTFREKEWYREKIFEIVNQIEDESMLKKIYTFSKTLKDILNEKEGG